MSWFNLDTLWTMAGQVLLMLSPVLIFATAINLAFRVVSFVTSLVQSKGNEK